VSWDIDRSHGGGPPPRRQSRRGPHPPRSAFADRTAREPADVALLVEGTYPFVRGGVASWVHRLIESLPDLAFSVVFLGARRSDHGPPAFPAPPNVRHFECHYLFEAPDAPAASGARGRCPMADVDRLHELLRTTSADAALDPVVLGGVARLLAAPGGLTRAHFLHGDDAWHRIDEAYRRDCPEASFTDYFWTIRATHAALFAVAELARRLPPARSYHAVSTGYAGLLGALLRHRHGRPLVLTEHGIYTKERKIDLATAEHVPGDGDPAVPGFGRRLWMRLFQGLGRIAYASADRIIALHEASRRRQVQDGADPVRTRVIPNGVDLGRFARVRAARPPTPPPVLGFLGRVVPIKDVKCFVRAMKAVVGRVPEAQGWIVGPTAEDESYARECSQLAHAMGLEGRVTFTGYRPAEDVLAQLGVLVLTSISEGLPLVVLEAFASGLPVVTTDVGACRELVEGRTPEDRAQGAAGAVVPIADPEAVARAALALLQDPARWRAAREVGLRRAETYYSEARVFEAYRQTYHEVGTWRE
jgi:glycosyltransferase involved in cell wall biosynthesis